MIFLFVLVTFFSSVDREPFAVLKAAPSIAACEDVVKAQTAQAEKDPEVSGYVIKCITVPTKA